jgi:hypothetical protein
MHLKPTHMHIQHHRYDLPFKNFKHSGEIRTRIVCFSIVCYANRATAKVRCSALHKAHFIHCDCQIYQFYHNVQADEDS